MHGAKTYRTERKSRQSTIIVKGFNVLLLILLEQLDCKISNNVIDLNNTANYLDLMGICRTLPATAECMFLSSAHRTFTQICYGP